MPEYALMSLSMPEYGYILLNVPEYAGINCSDYARVLNIPRYSYNINYIRILVFSVCTSRRSATIASFLTRVRTYE